MSVLMSCRRNEVNSETAAQSEQKYLVHDDLPLLSSCRLLSAQLVEAGTRLCVRFDRKRSESNQRSFVPLQRRPRRILVRIYRVSRLPRPHARNSVPTLPRILLRLRRKARVADVEWVRYLIRETRRRTGAVQRSGGEITRFEARGAGERRRRLDARGERGSVVHQVIRRDVVEREERGMKKRRIPRLAERLRLDQQRARTSYRTSLWFFASKRRIFCSKIFRLHRTSHAEISSQRRLAWQKELKQANQGSYAQKLENLSGVGSCAPFVPAKYV